MFVWVETWVTSLTMLLISLRYVSCTTVRRELHQWTTYRILQRSQLLQPMINPTSQQTHNRCLLLVSKQSLQHNSLCFSFCLHCNLTEKPHNSVWRRTRRGDVWGLHIKALFAGSFDLQIMYTKGQNYMTISITLCNYIGITNYARKLQQRSNETVLDELLATESNKIIISRSSTSDVI